VILCYPRTSIIDSNGKHVKKYLDDCNLNSSKPVERFKNYLFRRAGLCNPILSVIRSSFLKRTSLIGNYNGSDIILLAELALLGKFYEIPDYLFFRRIHAEKSDRANPDPISLAGWFDPKKRRRIILPEWRRSYEYIMCIIHADLSFFDRIYCFILLGKVFKWNRKNLTQELRTAFKKSY